MKLIVHELVGSLYQEVTPEKNTQVESIRPHIYKHNIPVGSLSLELHDINGQTIATSSNSIEASDITTEAFFHGYIKFDIKVHLMKDVTYRVVLVSSGYTFSESNYFGWCSGFELGKYPATYSNNEFFLAPLDLEIWERK